MHVIPHVLLIFLIHEFQTVETMVIGTTKELLLKEGDYLRDKITGIAYLRRGTNISTLVRCVRLCLETDGCGALFYKDSDSDCRLYPDTTSHETTGITSKAGWVYYTVGHPPTSFQDICEANVGYTYNFPTNSCLASYAGILATHADSQTVCQIQGGSLARIRNSFDRSFIETITAVSGTGYYHIQGNKATGTWRFDNGAAMTYFLFAPGEPNTHEDYLAIHSNGKMHGVIGNENIGYVCEILL